MSYDDVEEKIIRAIEFIIILEYAEYEYDLEWWNTHLMSVVN